jgi:hypothetical protein
MHQQYVLLAITFSMVQKIKQVDANAIGIRHTPAKVSAAGDFYCNN